MKFLLAVFVFALPASAQSFFPFQAAQDFCLLRVSGLSVPEAARRAMDRNTFYTPGVILPISDTDIRLMAASMARLCPELIR